NCWRTTANSPRTDDGDRAVVTADWSGYLRERFAQEGNVAGDVVTNHVLRAGHRRQTRAGRHRAAKGIDAEDRADAIGDDGGDDLPHRPTRRRQWRPVNEGNGI